MEHKWYLEFGFNIWLLMNATKSDKGEWYYFKPHSNYPYSLNQLRKMFEGKFQLKSLLPCK